MKNTWQGLILVLILALASDRIAHLPWFAMMGISSLIVAILLGIFLGNSLPHSKILTPGIQFSAKKNIAYCDCIVWFSSDLS